MRSSLPMTRPIPSITPVRPGKPRPATPTSAVKSHAKTPPQPKPSGVNMAASITGVPITVSPVVNIRPPGVMAQFTGNKSLSVAISNPAVSVTISHPALVANSNLSSVSMNSPGVSSMMSAASAGRNMMINFTAPPAGVTPLAKNIRPPFQVSYRILLLLCNVTGCYCLGSTDAAPSYIKEETTSTSCTTKTSPTHSEASHAPSSNVKSFIAHPTTKAPTTAYGS